MGREIPQSAPSFGGIAKPSDAADSMNQELEGTHDGWKRLTDDQAKKKALLKQGFL